MLYKRIGSFSLWVFLMSVTMVYVSSTRVHNITHNFDFRSYIKWETHSTDNSVASKSKEKLMKEHALKGKEVPTLKLLLRPTLEASIKTKAKHKIILKPDIVIKKELSVKPVDTKVEKPLLIPDSASKMKKERTFEADKKVGLQIKDNIEDEESKNITDTLPPAAITNFSIVQ